MKLHTYVDSKVHHWVFKCSDYQGIIHLQHLHYTFEVQKTNTHEP